MPSDQPVTYKRSLTSTLDDMSTRIDDLEKNISDLMTQAGVEEFDGENKYGDASGTAWSRQRATDQISAWGIAYVSFTIPFRQIRLSCI